MHPHRKARFLIDRGHNAVLWALVTALVIGAVLAEAGSVDAQLRLMERVCPQAGDTGILPFGDGQDLLVNGNCHVTNDGTYKYHNVNIIKPGKLIFDETTLGQKIHFYAESILVENGGSLMAGLLSQFGHAPFGRFGGVLTFHLYGKAPENPNDQRTVGGIACRSPVSDAFPMCGIPKDIWNSNTTNTPNPMTCKPTNNLPGDVNDCFYQYEPLPFDNLNPPGFFGYKVLAVSYGGTLQLFGRKGAVYSGEDPSCELKVQGQPLDPSCSGESWVRLDTNTLVPAKANNLTLSRAVKTWHDGDQIVVTTTDYLPGHSEQCTIKGEPTNGGKTITVKDCVVTPEDDKNTVTQFLKWPHNGKKFDLTDRIPFMREGKPSGLTDLKFAETRAAVALLSRSIRIVSEGDMPIENSFPKDSYFGGHVVVRQGFESFQVQGVEFFQLGQGGRAGHYPVHFHMARKTPANTRVMDSSVWDSMNRWYVLHATQGVTLARNVGYLSIGHGFLIEDGTETDNKLYSNLGIFARAAVKNKQNPRNVPGILASPDRPGAEIFPFHSDYDHPSVFWIMNGWNDFQYNMAAGAGTCGACYWLVPGANSGMSVNMKWDSYAAEQKFNPTPDKNNDNTDKFPNTALARAAMTPLKEFLGNSCTSAMNSFQVNSTTEQCFGVAPNDPLPPVPNPVAPDAPLNPDDNNNTQTYYPHVGGGGRLATRCPANKDCSDNNTVPRCTDSTHADGMHGAEEANCDATVLDRYTTSFNWAAKNFAAIWLRPQWGLVINSVITDVQNAGITFVTSGDYLTASVITGYWGLARKNVFIGSTQPGNPFASDAGPFNPTSGLQCAEKASPQRCLSKDEGISLPITNFSDNQRLFSVYDGPSYQDSNAFLDIHPTNLTLDKPPNGFTKCSPDSNNGRPCNDSGWMNVNVQGMRNDGKGHCYLPNAAIAWKQPNGFYYAPAFHSTNLFFDKVDIRHFVIEPLFKPGTFETDLAKVKDEYCVWDDATFRGFTDIDRQTVLNDDDGSLTGLLSTFRNPPTETISVNLDPFFNAPVETTECASDWAPSDPKGPPATAKTSPYQYVTTVVYPKCGRDSTCFTCSTDNNCEPGQHTTLDDLRCNKNKGQASCSWWDADCTTIDSPNACYGVPLSRQFLTDAETKAMVKAPVIRMMGTAKFQRSSLTVNHGQYDIDTSVSLKQQTAQANNLNVFQGGRSYDVFFVYAKPTTQQTYTMFVGTGLGSGWEKNVVMGHVSRIDFAFTGNLNKMWADLGTPNGWTRKYDSSTGLLTVTVNMESLKDEFDLTKNKLGETLCQPPTICAWSKNDCECSITDTKNYLYDSCHEKNAQGKDAICSWSVKDLDCPAAGCIGFEVAFDTSFTASDQAPKATTSPFPSDFSAVSFVKVKEGISGKECHYP